MSFIDTGGNYNYYPTTGYGGYGYGGYGGGIDPYGNGYGGYYSQYYAAAQQAFQNQQYIDDALVGRMEGIASQAMGLAGTVTQEWENTFIPELNKLIQDANTYASAARIQLAMGEAESNVAQAFDAQRNNALADLQSFGIDPSSGRYASLDAAERTQEAAAQAGAGNIAEQQTEAVARALRSEAIQASANLPGYATSAMGVAAGALKFPPNPAYPPLAPPRPRPTGLSQTPPRSSQQGGTPIQYNQGKLPQQQPKNNQQPPQPQMPTPTGGAAKPPPSSGGSLPQPTNVPYGGPVPDNSALSPSSPNDPSFSPGGANDLSTGGSSQIYSPEDFNAVPADNQTTYPADWQSGAGNPFANPDQYPLETGAQYDPGYGYEGSADASQPTDTTGVLDNSTVPTDTSATGYDPSLESGSTTDPGYGYEGSSNASQYTDTSTVDNINAGSGTGTTSSDFVDTPPSYDDSGYARGGAIPYSASPSGGRETDDIRGKVRQTGEPIHVDAGEFIMPRHAVAYKGQHFFRKIIEDSKKFHAKHNQHHKSPAARGAIPMR